MTLISFLGTPNISFNVLCFPAAMFAAGSGLGAHFALSRFRIILSVFYLYLIFLYEIKDGFSSCIVVFCVLKHDSKENNADLFSFLIA